MHCAAPGCSTNDEAESAKAARTMAERAVRAAEVATNIAAADQAEAEAAAKAQAAAAAQVAEAPATTASAVEVPTAPAVVAQQGIDALLPAVTEEAPRANDPPADDAAPHDTGDGVPLAPGGQAADAAPGVHELGNVAALAPAPPGQRPDGSYKCDAPDCTRSADNASVVVVQARAKCGVIQLCAACKTSTACSALTELHEQDHEVTVCAGCLPLYLPEKEPEYWLGYSDDGRAIIREAAAAVHASMLATRSQRMSSGGGGGGQSVGGVCFGRHRAGGSDAGYARWHPGVACWQSARRLRSRG